MDNLKIADSIMSETKTIFAFFSNLEQKYKKAAYFYSLAATTFLNNYNYTDANRLFRKAFETISLCKYIYHESYSYLKSIYYSERNDDIKEKVAIKYIRFCNKTGCTSKATKIIDELILKYNNENRNDEIINLCTDLVENYLSDGEIKYKYMSVLEAQLKLNQNLTETQCEVKS